MSLCQIILPTYNRRHILVHTIPHYLSLGAPLLVVDDGSTDGTAAWLGSLGIAVVRHPVRRGLPAARNTGIRFAKTPWVLFGEDDVLFAPGHVEALLFEALRLPHCAVVAGSLFTGHSWGLPSERPPWESGELLNPDLLLGNFAAPIERAIPLPSVHACALVDRSAVLEAGGYDESLSDSAFREESDCFARIWQLGRTVWLTPATWGIHVRHRLGGGCRGRSGMLAKLTNRATYWRNNARFVDRHWRLWRRWTNNPTPARLKWNFFVRLVAQQWMAIRK